MARETAVTALTIAILGLLPKTDIARVLEHPRWMAVTGTAMT